MVSCAPFMTTKDEFKSHNPGSFVDSCFRILASETYVLTSDRVESQVTIIARICLSKCAQELFVSCLNEVNCPGKKPIVIKSSISNTELPPTNTILFLRDIILRYNPTQFHHC